MKATIKNVVKEGERVRIFVSYSDGSENSFLAFPNSTEEYIENEISAVLREKERIEEESLTLALKLINKEIE